jgi:hypothetical protein
MSRTDHSGNLLVHKQYRNYTVHSICIGTVGLAIQCTVRSPVSYYDMSDNIRVIYAQDIIVQIIRFLCTTVRLRNDVHGTTVGIVRGSYVLRYR